MQIYCTAFICKSSYMNATADFHNPTLGAASQCDANAVSEKLDEETNDQFVRPFALVQIADMLTVVF